MIEMIAPTKHICDKFHQSTEAHPAVTHSESF